MANIIQILEGGKFSPSYSNVIDFPDIKAQNRYWDAHKLKRTETKTPIQLYEEYPLPLVINYTMDEAKGFNYLRIEVETDRNIYKWYYYFVTKVEYNSPNSVKLYLQLDVWQTYMFDYEIIDSFVVREHQDRYDKNDDAILNRKDEQLDLGTQLDISEPTYLGDGLLWFHIITNRALCIKTKGRVPVIINEETDKRATINGLAQPFFHYIVPFDPTDPDKPFFIQDGDSYTYRMIESGNFLSQALATSNITLSIRVLPYPPIPCQVDGQYISFGDSVNVQRPNDSKVKIADHAGDPDGENDKLLAIQYHRTGLGAVFGPSQAEAGDIVTIYHKVDKDHAMTDLKVTDAAGQVVPVENGKFTMPETAVQVKATFTGGISEGSITHTLKPVSAPLNVIHPQLATPNSTVRLDIQNRGKGTFSFKIINTATRQQIKYDTHNEEVQYWTFTMPTDANVNIEIEYFEDAPVHAINYRYSGLGEIGIDKAASILPGVAPVGSDVEIKIVYATGYTGVVTKGAGSPAFTEEPIQNGVILKFKQAYGGAVFDINTQYINGRYTITSNINPIGSAEVEVQERADAGDVVVAKIKDGLHYTHTATVTNATNVVEDPYGTLTFTMKESNVIINVTGIPEQKYPFTVNYNHDQLDVTYQDTIYKGDTQNITITPKADNIAWEVDRVLGGTWNPISSGIAVESTEGGVSVYLKSGVKVPVTYEYSASAASIEGPTQVMAGDTFDVVVTNKPDYSSGAQITGVEPNDWSVSGSTYTIHTKPTTKKVHFKLNSVKAQQIYYNYDSNQVKLLAPTHAARPGDYVLFNVNPLTGYEIISVTAAGIVIDNKGGGQYSFTMPDSGSVTVVVASQAKSTYSITYHYDPTECSLSSDDSYFNKGSDFSFYIKPEPGWKSKGAQARTKSGKMISGGAEIKGDKVKITFYTSKVDEDIDVFVFNQEDTGPAPETTYNTEIKSNNDAEGSKGWARVDKTIYKKGDIVTFSMYSYYQPDEYTGKAYSVGCQLKYKNGQKVPDNLIWGTPTFEDDPVSGYRYKITISYTMPAADTYMDVIYTQF